MRLNLADMGKRCTLCGGRKEYYCINGSAMSFASISGVKITCVRCNGSGREAATKEIENVQIEEKEIKIEKDEINHGDKKESSRKVVGSKKTWSAKK